MECTIVRIKVEAGGEGQGNRIQTLLGDGKSADRHTIYMRTPTSYSELILIILHMLKSFRRLVDV